MGPDVHRADRQLRPALPNLGDPIHLVVKLPALPRGELPERVHPHVQAAPRATRAGTGTVGRQERTGGPGRLNGAYRHEFSGERLEQVRGHDLRDVRWPWAAQEHVAVEAVCARLRPTTSRPPGRPSAIARPLLGDARSHPEMLPAYSAGMSPDIVIVGAGPAGLSVAATLRDHGAACTVLERANDVGAAWQARYDSLHLHTARWLSGLPGARVPRRYGPWVARDDFVAYLRDYAAQRDIRPEFGVTVQRIERDADTWQIQTSEGPRTASAVVVATGYCRKPFIPDWPGRAEFSGSLVHSAAYREPSRYRGRSVLVVGAGNSAAEIAVELVTAGADVTLSVRTPPNIVRRDTLGLPSQLLGITLRRVPERVMNPLTGMLRRVAVPDLTRQGLPAPADGFSQFLRSQTVPILDHGFVREIRAGRIRVVPAVDSLAAETVRLTDGSSIQPDAVICATGYRPGLDGMVGHLGVLDEHGQPTVRGAATHSDAPGLFFVGVSVQLSGLVREIGAEAHAVAEAIERQPVR